VNENDARKLLKKRFGEIASRRFVGPQEERVMFEDLKKGIERDYDLRGLRSSRAAKGRMVHLKEYFGDLRWTLRPIAFARTRPIVVGRARRLPRSIERRRTSRGRFGSPSSLVC
jgi:hypothetical protein